MTEEEKPDALSVLNQQLNDGEISFEEYRKQALALGYIEWKIRGIERGRFREPRRG